MLDFERTFKIKVLSRGTVFEYARSRVDTHCNTTEFSILLKTRQNEC